MEADSQSHLVVDNTLGAAFIGVICAACLYGVSCFQTWFYLVRYTTDNWYIRPLVIIVWVFETIHQALISHTVYFYLVTNYANASMQAYLVWSILLEVLFNGLIGFLVQSFLTVRVWRLSGQNNPLAAIIATLVLGEFGCSVAFTICSMKLRTWDDLAKLRGLSMTVNVLGAVSDVAIAASLFYFLQRSKTGFRNSDTMISRLIMFSVSTGLLTSICAIASLISIIVWGNTLIYVSFYFSIGRLYSNSLLATLNARKSIRRITTNDTKLSFLQTPSKSRTTWEMMSMRTTPQSISIKVDTTQEFMRDAPNEEDTSESYVTEKPYPEKSDEVQPTTS